MSQQEEPTIEWAGIISRAQDLDEKMLKVREQEHILADAMRDLVKKIFQSNNFDSLPTRSIKSPDGGGYIILYSGIGASLQDRSRPNGDGGYSGCEEVLGIRKSTSKIVTVWQSYRGYTGRGMYFEDLYVPEDFSDTLSTEATDSEIASRAVPLAKSILDTLTSNLTINQKYLETLQALVKVYEEQEPDHGSA